MIKPDFYIFQTKVDGQ